MSNSPIEPSAVNRVFAAHIRQMYLALMAEGFTSQEALAIVGHMIALLKAQQ